LIDLVVKVGTCLQPVPDNDDNVVVCRCVVVSAGAGTVNPRQDWRGKETADDLLRGLSLSVCLSVSLCLTICLTLTFCYVSEIQIIMTCWQSGVAPGILV